MYADRLIINYSVEYIKHLVTIQQFHGTSNQHFKLLREKDEKHDLWIFSDF